MTYAFVALFLVLMVYIGYFNIVESKDIINSPYNPRLDSMADRVVRVKNGTVVESRINPTPQPVSEIEW